MFKPSSSTRRGAMLCLLSLACIWPTQAQAPKDLRVALVIGNSAYPGKLALSNPKNDAAAMAERLRQLGFTVLEVKDGTRAQMDEAVQKLFGTLKGRQGIGMLYYAGHGIQVDWKNYMIPIDAKLNSAQDVKSQTVDVGDVIEALKLAKSRMNIIVLDACRDNPFADKSAKGLAPVDAPPGTLLAYATAPGNVAEDGNGQNGLYTKHLLAELSKPVSIENVFKRVRYGVRQESQGRQIPWESTSLEDDFSFAAQKEVPAITRGAQRDADYAEQKADWDQIKTSTDPNVYLAFLKKYPSGLISEVAQSKLETLTDTKLVQLSDGKADQPVLKDVYRLGDQWVYDRQISSFGRSSSKAHFAVNKIENGIVYITQRISATLTPTTTSEFVMNNEGALISFKAPLEGSYNHDPPLPMKPSGPMKIGYKSSSRSSAIRNGQIKGQFDSEMEIISREKITVPAGSFNTFKIKIKSETGGVISGVKPTTYTYWYAKDLIIPIKKITQYHDFNIEITENLVSLNRGSVDSKLQ